MSIRSDVEQLKKDLDNEATNKLINMILDKYWYSWFCDRSEIITKTKNILILLERIKASPLINYDSYTFEISNNYPLYGFPYEDIRIVDGDTTLFLIVPKSGIEKKKGVAEIYSVENNFDRPIYSGDVEGLISFLNDV